MKRPGYREAVDWLDRDGPLAKWSSAGGKWTAELHPAIGGYRLSERKNGKEVGASFRPNTDDPQGRWQGLHNDAEAIAYFDNHVRNSFDVGMRRVHVGEDLF